MSVITDVVLVTMGSEREALASINGWLLENDSRRPQQFCEISTEPAGGTKVASTHVWAAAFNYLDTYGLIGAIRQAPWNLPQSVVAYFDDEGSSTFVVSPRRDETWTLSPERPLPGPLDLVNHHPDIPVNVPLRNTAIRVYDAVPVSECGLLPYYLEPGCEHPPLSLGESWRCPDCGWVWVGRTPLRNFFSRAQPPRCYPLPSGSMVHVRPGCRC